MPQMYDVVFSFVDGLVKRLEELEKTAELYKGRASCSDSPSSASEHEVMSVFARPQG